MWWDLCTPCESMKRCPLFPEPKWIYLSSHTWVPAWTYLLIQLDKLAGPHLIWWLKVCNACDKILRQTRVVMVVLRGDPTSPAPLQRHISWQLPFSALRFALVASRPPSPHQLCFLTAFSCSGFQSADWRQRRDLARCRHRLAIWPWEPTVRHPDLRHRDGRKIKRKTSWT